ncbi:hypothetical protein GCM10027341_00600 [Spirosoma knui]
MKTKEKYFWYVIVCIGGAGVWLPILITLLSNQNFDWKDVPPNMVTYFISVVVSGCADQGIRLLDTLEKNSLETSVKKWQSMVMDGIGILALSFVLVLVATLSSVFQHVGIAYISSGAGIYLSLRTWWNANVKEEKVDPFNSLGGSDF